MTPAPDRHTPELAFTPLDAVLRRPTPTAPQPGPNTTPEAPEPDDTRTRRMRARAGEKRADRDHSLELDRKRRQIDREDRTARRNQRRTEQAAARTDRKTRRAELRAAHADRDARIKTHALATARRVMVIGPITAPMAVAWSSQTSYAMDAFDWWLPAAIGFAAAWELSTTFTGWMYHQARKAGDRGIEYRILTWIFAMGAAGMNYAYHTDAHGDPTQASIAFSAMSITGMVLWEAYARLVHRQYLRAHGLVPKARPRLGAVRWIRYPVHSWTAWSLAILEADLDTAAKAWTAAADRLGLDRAERTERTAEKKADRAARRAPRTADRQADPVRKTRTADGPDRKPKADRKQRTAGPDRADRTSTASQQPDRERTAVQPDRTAADLNLTPDEEKAIDKLRSADRSISKRSIAEAVRADGGSIASDRAVQIARHFRTLRSAA